jgi:hypothetical protein
VSRLIKLIRMIRVIRLITGSLMRGNTAPSHVLLSCTSVGCFATSLDSALIDVLRMAKVSSAQPSNSTCSRVRRVSRVIRVN